MEITENFKNVNKIINNHKYNNNKKESNKLIKHGYFYSYFKFCSVQFNI